jgi:hypothetical protein
MLVSEQINQYIAEHPEWQRRVLVRLRQMVHATCNSVEENWRGGGPSFEQGGAPIITLSSSKTSVTVCFPNGSLMKPGKLEFEPCSEDKCERAVKFREGDQLPEKAFAELLMRSMVCIPKTEVRKKGNPVPDLETVLRKDPTAWANWEAFPAVLRHEYSTWVEESRQEEGRKHRIAKAFEMIREGMAPEESARRLRGS